MDIELFVQSRGFGPDKDYQWIRLSDGYMVDPPVVSEDAYLGLFQSGAPSIIAIRQAKWLYLLVSGLSCEERIDFMRRPIQNAVAIIVHPDQEDIVRGIIVVALRKPDRFALLLDQLITTDYDSSPDEGSVGFTVDSGLVDQIAVFKAVGRNDPVMTKRQGANNDVFRNALAMELDEARLPDIEGPLVVVTKNKDPETLRVASVWRSLSALFVPPASGEVLFWYEWNTDNRPRPKISGKSREDFTIESKTSEALQMSSSLSVFPSWTVERLTGESFYIPDTFSGQLNVLLVGSEGTVGTDMQQVNEWARHIRELMQNYPQLTYYNLIFVASNLKFVKRISDIINFSNSSPETQSHVLYLYGDISYLTNELNIGDQSRTLFSDVALFLVDIKGVIRWQVRGAYNDTKMDSLRAIVKSLSINRH